MFASRLNGASYLLWIAIGDDADFVQRESLDCVQDEGLTVGDPSAFECKMHEGKHLVGISDVFGS